MFKWTSLFIVIIFIGCNFFGKKLGHGIIPPEKFVSLLTDIHICNGILTSQAKQNDDNGYNNELYDKVFEKHLTSRKELNNTIDYYSDKPDELNKIYEQVVDRLNELQEEINKEEHEGMSGQPEKISKEKPGQFNRKDTVSNPEIQESQKPGRKNDPHKKQKPDRKKNLQKKQPASQPVNI